jgi:hypothetical protein
MSQQGTVTSKILKAVRRAPGSDLDDLLLTLPELTWNQVFLEVDHLSRTGQVRLVSLGHGAYTISLPDKEKRMAKPKLPMVTSERPRSNKD